MQELFAKSLRQSGAGGRANVRVLIPGADAQIGVLVSCYDTDETSGSGVG
jgi:hypothetical protein